MLPNKYEVFVGAKFHSEEIKNIQQTLNSLMTDVPILQSQSVDWFLYDGDLYNERVNHLSFQQLSRQLH